MFERTVVLEGGELARQEIIGDYIIDYFPAGGILVVTFEPAGIKPDKRLNSRRDGWGQKFILGEGHALLSVKGARTDWYRGRELHDFFNGVVFRNIAKSHDKVMFYGASMGGYGAIAFSQAAPGATVLTYSPQSTLRPDLVPWETRYAEGRAADWTGDFSDAADSVSAAHRIYIAYDAFYALDRKHVERLNAPNVVGLRTPCAGHKVDIMLSKTRQIKAVFRACMDDRPELYRGIIRSRRNWDEYYLVMAMRTNRPVVKAAMYERARTAAPDNTKIQFEWTKFQFQNNAYDKVVGAYETLEPRTLSRMNRSRLYMLQAMAARSYLETGDAATARAMIVRLRETDDDIPASAYRNYMIQLCKRLEWGDMANSYSRVKTRT